VTGMTLLDKGQKRFMGIFVPISVLIGGLCCFTPVVLVLLGLSTVSFAASLSDTLYHSYKWAFRGAALGFLLIAFLWYIHKKENVCSFDDLKRKKNKILNFLMLILISAVLGYILWLYVIVELIGMLLGIWG
jgi:hypothetical protein